MKYLLLIGAQKSGTTYLHNLLAQDPRIAVHPKKEPKYFAMPKFAGRDYHSMFQFLPGSEVLLDSSASYLHVQGTAERAAQHLGSSAFVFAVLRNPVERAISAYLHSVKHGRDLRSPEEVFSLDALCAADIRLEEDEKIKSAQRRGLISLPRDGDQIYYDPVFHYRYVTNSFYRHQLDEYFEHFGSVLTIDFRDLKADPHRIANLVRACVGCSDTINYKLDVPTNVTKLDRWSALRKSRSNALPVKLNLVAAAWRIFSQRYDKKHLNHIAIRNWVPLATTEYVDLIQSRPIGPK